VGVWITVAVVAIPGFPRTVHISVTTQLASTVVTVGAVKVCGDVVQAVEVTVEMTIGSLPTPVHDSIW
jgi:hypothetical protein